MPHIVKHAFSLPTVGENGGGRILCHNFGERMVGGANFREMKTGHIYHEMFILLLMKTASFNFTCIIDFGEVLVGKNSQCSMARYFVS